MRLAVLGATGQLGSEIVKAAEKRGHEVDGFRDGRWWVTKGAKWYGDVTDAKAMREILEAVRPDVVINTAAFHDVDSCERDPQKAFEVNALGAENIQAICDDLRALHIFISTDHVFGGKPPEHTSGYEWFDDPHPLNAYGWSKLMGENAVMGSDYGAVARVSYLFGKGGSKQKGGNFVDKVLAQLDGCRQDGGATPISRPTNVVVSPTYCVDAAEAILNITQSGLFHCSNYGQTSLHGFARSIARLAGFDVPVEPSTYTWQDPTAFIVKPPANWTDEQMRQAQEALDDYFSGDLGQRKKMVVLQSLSSDRPAMPPARRPEFSALIPSDDLGIERTWAEGVREYLKEIGRLAEIVNLVV